MTAPSSALLARFREFYDQFSAAWIPRLGELYAERFEFRDPFHTIVDDRAALEAYFTRVLKLPESRFITEDQAVGSDGAYVRWRWVYKLRTSAPQREIIGVTHLRATEDGERFAAHRDLFDAAEAVYEQVPIVGAMIRAVKKRI